MDPIQAVLAQKGLEAAEKAAGGFLEKLVGPVAEELGLMAADRVRSFRLKKQVQLLGRAQEMLGQAGIEPHSVPLKTIAPLLEGATLEEDEALSEKWASLLANAAGGDIERVPPSFPRILSDLSASDARLLDFLLDSPGAQPEPWPNAAGTRPEGLPPGLPEFSLPAELGDATARRLSMLNLRRLGLAEEEFPPKSWVNTEGYLEIQRVVIENTRVVRLTELGVEFGRACRPPSMQV